MNHLKGIHHNLRFNLKAYPSNPTRLFVNLSFLFFLSSIGLAQSPRAHSPETKSSVFAFHSNFGLIETLNPTGQDRNVPPSALNQPVRQSERRDAEVTGELDDVDGASSSRAFVDVADVPTTSRARSETIPEAA